MLSVNTVNAVYMVAFVQSIYYFMHMSHLFEPAHNKTYNKIWPRGYKTFFFIFNSPEHEILRTNLK